MNVTGTGIVFDNFLLERERGNVHPESDTLIAGLSGSGYTPSLAHTDISSITDELAGNGYNRQVLQNVVVTLEFNIVRVVCDPLAFQAVGGELTPRYWWVFDDTHPSDILICYGLIDASGEDVVMIPSQPLTFHPNQNGIWRTKRPA